MNRPVSAFQGTGVAIVTPFTDSGGIDYEGFGRMIDHVINGGVDYIVVMGTTGETPTLSKEERHSLLRFSLEKAASRVPLVVGIGGNNTAEVVQSLRTIPMEGVGGILSVSPYYNKPTQEGIYLHFKAIAENSPLPVILYTVPGRTGGNISAETTLRLANDFPMIAGIKEASGNLFQVFHLLKNRPENFLVISGDDGLTLPMMSAGADGLISVIANAYPEKVSTMVRFGLAGDFYHARKIHFELLDMINALFADGSPGGIKALLALKGLCSEVVRLPLVPVNKQTRDLIYNLEKQLT